MFEACSQDLGRRLQPNNNNNNSYLPVSRYKQHLREKQRCGFSQVHDASSRWLSLESDVTISMEGHETSGHFPPWLGAECIGELHVKSMLWSAFGQPFSEVNALHSVTGNHWLPTHLVRRKNDSFGCTRRFSSVVMNSYMVLPKRHSWLEHIDTRLRQSTLMWIQGSINFPSQIMVVSIDENPWWWWWLWFSPAPRDLCYDHHQQAYPFCVKFQ